MRLLPKDSIVVKHISMSTDSTPLLSMEEEETVKMEKASVCSEEKMERIKSLICSFVILYLLCLPELFPRQSSSLILTLVKSIRHRNNFEYEI